MQLEHEFTVPVPVDEAWRVLLDIERVAPCMPGATVESVEGDTITGNVKVKVGPITVTYRGKATFTEKDADAHRVVLSASGKEARGPGTARATVTGTLTERDGSTSVSVVTDLSITGRPAQFGRGVMNEVGDKILGQFASCLSERLGSDGSPAAADAAGATAAGTGAAAAPAGTSSEAEGAEGAGGAGTGSGTPTAAAGPARREAEPIDLLRTAGGPLLGRARVALGAAGAGLLALFVIVFRRRRR
jgi:carbon monoxide dehydrogenase subunit G